MTASPMNPLVRFIWLPASGILFSHAVAQYRLTFTDCDAVTVTPHAFHTIMVIDSTAEPLGTEAHDHDTRSYQDNSFTQCSRLLRDGSVKSVNEHYESVRCEL